MDANIVEKPSRLERIEQWCWHGGTKTLDAIAMGLFNLIGVPFLAGLGILGYQGLFWLKHGTWKPITTFDILSNFLPLNFMKWVIVPTDWVGLSEVAYFILFSSAGLVLIALGVLVAYPLMYLAVAISHASDMLFLRIITKQEAAGKLDRQT